MSENMYDKIKEDLIKYGKLLVDRGFTVGTGGNLSYYDREKDTMLISPSNIEFHLIQKKDIAVIKNGVKIDGRKPSSEWMMHLEIYKARKDISALIHAHTKYSTAISCTRKGIPPIHYMLAMAGRGVECAKYAKYGTRELADNALEALGENYAVLLANHGIITGKKTLAQAFEILEQVEYVSELYINTKVLGGEVLLSEKEMEDVLESFGTYKG